MATDLDGVACSRPALWALWTAAVAGTVHALFSLYWAVGGEWLVSTLGQHLVDTFAGRRWLLMPVGVVKIGFAVLPLLLARMAWPVWRLSRAVCWVGAAVLVFWGALNTVTGNLVLAGALDPSDGYDHDGMVGHAWLWDPLFLLWGVALSVALLLTRRRRPIAHPLA